MSAEPLAVESGLRYQVVDPARQVLDPGAAVVVYDGGVPLAPAAYVVDHLFGAVILAASPAGAVTIDASYLPRTRLARPRSFSISVSRVSNDITAMAPETIGREKIMGLRDVTVSVDQLEELPLLQEYTFGTEEVTLLDIFEGNVAPLVLSISLGTALFRAFVKLQAHSAAGELEGLVESSLEYEGAARNGVIYGIKY